MKQPSSRYRIFSSPEVALAGDVDHASVRVERHRLDAHEHLACGSEDVQVDPFDVGYFDVER